MANDERYNCNNGDNNDVHNPPSTLEQLLIIQAQVFSKHAANPGANARYQPTIAISGSKTLIREEKG
jgi:hypothetical protein